LPTGNRISLISKKNIRYEGTLYSINEANATVALQNVRSYGTEGRERIDASTTYVAPQDSVHPYLLFRGCDIKDLHVHESAAQPAPSDPAIVSASAPSEVAEAAATAQASREKASAASATQEQPKPPAPSQPKPKPPTVEKGNDDVFSNPTDRTSKPEQQKENQEQRPPNKQGGRGPAANRRPRKPNPAHQVGTGASLLNRKARGTIGGGKFGETITISEQC
jgi:protein LSM14